MPRHELPALLKLGQVLEIIGLEREVVAGDEGVDSRILKNNLKKVNDTEEVESYEKFGKSQELDNKTQYIDIDRMVEQEEVMMTRVRDRTNLYRRGAWSVEDVEDEVEGKCHEVKERHVAGSKVKMPIKSKKSKSKLTRVKKSKTTIIDKMNEDIGIGEIIKETESIGIDEGEFNVEGCSGLTRRAGKNKQNVSIHVDEDEVNDVIMSTEDGEFCVLDNLEENDLEAMVFKEEIVQDEFEPVVEGEEEELCPAVYHQKKSVKSVHMGLRFPCDYCDYSAKYRSDLKAHNFAVHSHARLECPHCNFQARQLGNLRNHIAYKHNGITFACDECGVKYSNPGALKKHKLNHARKAEGLPLPRFPCDYCGFTSTDRSKLKRHEMVKHLGLPKTGMKQYNKVKNGAKNI